MAKERELPEQKGREILSAMREGATVKKHLDQQKFRAEEAVRLAIQNRDEEAYRVALISLGVDLESAVGREHVKKFRQLPPKR
jgi:hypothetical protein